MSCSMAFSLASPTTLHSTNTKILSVRNHTKIDVNQTAVSFPQKSASSSSPQLQLELIITEKATVLGRREAIRLGFFFGLADVAVNGMKPRPCLAVEKAGAAGVCEFVVAPSGLGFCDKVVGTGGRALKGQLIKAHYVGRLEDGTVFDSSYNRGKPLAFRIGVGEVIKGWDQGILGGDGIPPMLAGGKRIIKLPPDLGYGVRGAGCKGGSCVIPPNSVLLFDVEFIGKA